MLQRQVCKRQLALLNSKRYIHTSRLILQQQQKKNVQENIQENELKNDPVDEFSPEIEFGISSKTNNGGRVAPPNATEPMNQLLELKKPDANTLLPLERDVVVRKRRFNASKENRSKEEEQKNVGFKDIIDSFKLIVDLARGRKRIDMSVKKEASIDPIDKLVNVESWDEMNEELEVLMSRVKMVKKGQELCVIGGGLSGLSLAYFVSKSRPDINVRVLEAKDTVGGYMESKPQQIENEQTVFEFGPRTLLPSHPGTVIAVQLIDQLGLWDKLVGIPKHAAVNAKGMYFDNQVMKMPDNVSETWKWMTKSSFTKGMRFGMLKEIFTKSRKPDSKEESVEQFVTRRFNSVVADRLLSGVFRGIYAGDINELSAKSVARMNKLYMLERSKGTSIVGAMLTGVYSAVDSYANQALPLISQSLVKDTVFPNYEKEMKKYSMLTLQGGIQQLAFELEKVLGNMKNVTIEKNAPVKKIENGNGENKNLVLTTENGLSINSEIAVSTVAASSIGPSLVESQETQMLCSNVKYTNMAVVDFFFPGQQIGKNWFGFLVPKSQTTEEEVLGVIFDSAVRNGAVPVELTEKGEAETIQQAEAEHAHDKRSWVDMIRDELDDGEQSATVSANDGKLTESTTLTVMMGGHLWDNKKMPSEQQVIENAVNFLKKTLNQDIQNYHVKVKFQPQCIPQYTVGHSERMQRVHDAVARDYKNRLYLSGMTFGRGVGLSDCLIDSVSIAARFSEQRKLLFPRFYINHTMNATHPKLYA